MEEFEAIVRNVLLTYKSAFILSAWTMVVIIIVEIMEHLLRRQQPNLPANIVHTHYHVHDVYNNDERETTDDEHETDNEPSSLPVSGESVL